MPVHSPADLLPSEIILEMRGIRKAFGPVAALDEAHFQLHRREIHGLLGANGAGKTTLMNILYGLYRADGGEVVLNDKPVQIRSPRDALHQRIGMVHQHFLQIDNFTVAQNVALGTPARGRVLLNLAEAEERVREQAARFGLDVNPQARVADLPMGARQRVEILKALYRNVRILILDEPTTNLTPQEVDSLFGSLRAMVDDEISVVFITHKIREALHVCDRVSVMRSGRNVLTLRRGETSEEALVRAMVGDEVDVRTSLLFSDGRSELRPPVSDYSILQVEGLSVATRDGVPRLKPCNLEVNSGEILGIAGVAGNGQREMVEALMGVGAFTHGRMWMDHVDVTGVDTARLLARGVTYISEDRLHDGFLPNGNVVQNLILGFHRNPPYTRGGWLDWKAAFGVSRRLIEEYRIRTTGPEEVAANLSGGNIQRLILARAFSHPCRLLIAHSPTRGLDVPSTEFVYTRLLELRAQGVAILMLSEDLDELLLLCDRIAVLYGGQIMGSLQREKFDRYEIGRLMSGVETSG